MPDPGAARDTGPDAARSHIWRIEAREYARHESRRGRRFAFERLDPACTALVVVDLVPFFVTENPYCRAIVPNVNRIARELRAAGGTVAWALPASGVRSAVSEEFFGPRIAQLYRDSGGSGPLAGRLWGELDVAADDVLVEKSAASAFFPGRCPLPELLHDRGVDTVLVTGTATNVCCESTARDASTLGFRTIMVADGNAARRDADHNATLHTIYRSFGDVRPTVEVIAMIGAAAGAQPESTIATEAARHLHGEGRTTDLPRGSPRRIVIHVDRVPSCWTADVGGHGPRGRGEERRMGLRGEAAILGFFELPAERKPTGPPRFSLEQYAQLAAAAIADAGLSASDVNGIITPGIREANSFVPSTVVEYLGIPASYAEIVDLGGANATAMVWRAAAAIELGICDAVLCVTPGGTLVPSSERKPAPPNPGFGASSNNYGSPQAEFDIPYGNLGQNGPYGQIARLYGNAYGYDPRVMAKISVDQRVNACATPGAVFHGMPITVEDVLASPMIADPLHMLEIVMPVSGGGGVVVASAELARHSRNRPVWITGFGERVAYKTPTYAEDLLASPMVTAAETAFGMAGVDRSDIDLASIYDCYTITVLMSLEDAGFCEKGKGTEFVAGRDLTFRGDFPLNTAGGQLGYGQPGGAGGMHHVADATRQIQGRAGEAQVADCNRAFVSGNGGIMSEQIALVLQGD